MRISDWSSDVCSSDLGVGPASNRGGSAGGKKSGGSSSAKRAKTQVDEAAKAADELKRNLDSILASLDPKAAQMQSLLEKGRDLDSALASQLINPTQWQEARTRLSDEIAALEKEMADSAVGQMFIPGIGMSNPRSEEHTSELQSLMRISYAVFCLKKKTNLTTDQDTLLHP